MALAGVGELEVPDDEWIRSFAVITCPPNEVCAPIHNRMPVILPPQAWAGVAWRDNGR